jgi:TetR/AcrR family transcriptional repressor of nem operon
MIGGYNGFSYADLAKQFGIRNASIHFHFPSKVDLVVRVVEEARTMIRAQIAALEEESSDGLGQLLVYTGYWERCIREKSAPFCIAAVLAAELPSLPEEVAIAVRGHFVDLTKWLEHALTLGVEQGTVQLDSSPAQEADAFLAAVYGAMLVARAFDDPDRFKAIVEAFIHRIRTDPILSGSATTTAACPVASPVDPSH